MRVGLSCAASCLLLCRAALGASDYAQEVLKDTPIAYWRFADAASAEGAPCKDETGQQPATYRGAVSLVAGVPGIGGRAAEFEGRSAYIEAALAPGQELNTLSVECWFRSTQAWKEPDWPASATLLSKATEGAASSDWVLLGGAAEGGQGVVMSRPGPKGGADFPLASTPGMNDGQWHHLVWTRSTEGENRLYADGTLTASGKDSGGSISNNRPLQIGGDPFLKGKYFEGALAEAAIYQTVLDEARIQLHLKAAGREPPGKRLPAQAKESTVMPLPAKLDTSAGWVKYEKNPVLGGQYGTCFDIAVLREGEGYRMWVSWRPKKSIALVESKGGLSWSAPQIVLPPAPTFWEEDINRPAVLKRDGGYHMWYTGQAKGKNSWIGYATSPDGKTWQRMSEKPVLSFDKPWEKVAVMCPHVLWDADVQLYRMWYSGGEQYEPNAIGYASSPDGLTWTKHEGNPVFAANKTIPWEQDRVAGCQVEKRGDWHIIFYIGYRDIDHAQIGIARSRDGLSNWQRHPENPIVRSGTGKWDDDACYKPYAIFAGKKWLLWYNGRRQSLEQIGVVIHEGEDLGFDSTAQGSSNVRTVR